MQETMKRAREITSSTSNTFVASGSGTTSTSHKYDRNDRVVIEKDGQTMEIKYKKAEEYLNQGWKIIEK